MVLWQIIIYIVQLLGCIVLLNIIFIVTELKVYIAYMSVFHMSYIFFFWGGGQDIILTFAVNYLCMYVVVMILFLLLLLCVTNKEIKYLTDFSIVNQVYI